MLIDTRTAGLQLTLAPDEVKRLVRRREIPFVLLPDKQVRFDQTALSTWVRGLSQPVMFVGGER